MLALRDFVTLGRFCDAGGEVLDAAFLGVPVLVWLAGALALFMAWNIGANDVANAMGTSVGSGALTVRRAVIVAGLFEFAGAYLAGGHVTDTVRKDILTPDALAGNIDLLPYGMLGSLAAAATLLLAATRFGLPVSTTHSIVGAIVGFGAIGLGIDAVEWGKAAEIFFTWLTSPLIGGALAFLVFSFTRWLILDREDPLTQVKRYGPIFFFLVTSVISLVVLFKGLKNLKLDFELPEALALSAGVGVVGALLGKLLLSRVEATGGEHANRFRDTERVFVILQVLTVAVEDQIDAGVQALVSYPAVTGDTGAPLRGVVADKVVGPAR